MSELKRVNNAVNKVVYSHDESFFISYNPEEHETAIVFIGPEKRMYYILTGDHVEEYEGFLHDNDLDSCIKYFKENKDEYACFWSDELLEEHK